MEDYNSCDDIDDDWFYESVMRYNTLQMFYLQNRPRHVLQIDELTLCIASRNQKCKNVELLELKLPAKLTMPAEEEGRSKENDFKMLSGIYIDQCIHQMDALREEKKIITSQANRKGFQIYSFHSNCESGDSNQECKIFAERDWITPNFTVQQGEKKIICSTCNHKPLLICDINTEEIVRELKYPFYEILSNCVAGKSDVSSCDSVNCGLLDNNALAVLNARTGIIALVDLRTEKTFSVLGKTEKKNSDEFWTISNSDFKTASNYFGGLSTRGNLSLYDMRNNNNSLKSECFKSIVNDLDILKLKMANRERFSISGIDSNIYVYNILKSECELTFTHNGHCQKTVSSEMENLVNDHIWLPSIGSNFVVSICNNRSLNCWEYNESIR